MSAMRPLLPLAPALAGLIAGCAGDRQPQPDPTQVRGLLAAVESPVATARAAGPAKFEQKLLKADRIVDNLARAQPEKIDADIAARLIGD